MVAALLDMASPDSAANNVVAPMRRLGLIDQDGSLTPRGHKWRVDASYGEACQEILDEIYPPELASFTAADGTTDKPKVITWLQHKGLGLSNAHQIAATYVMIAEKKLPEAAQPDSAKPKRPATTKKAQPKAAKQGSSKSAVLGAWDLPEPPESASAPAPSIHLDIQIHIAADTSPDQIDLIFASMAKHLYQK